MSSYTGSYQASWVRLSTSGWFVFLPEKMYWTHILTHQWKHSTFCVGLILEVYIKTQLIFFYVPMNTKSLFCCQGPQSGQTKLCHHPSSATTTTSQNISTISLTAVCLSWLISGDHQHRNFPWVCLLLLYHTFIHDLLQFFSMHSYYKLVMKFPGRREHVVVFRLFSDISVLWPKKT